MVITVAQHILSRRHVQPGQQVHLFSQESKHVDHRRCQMSFCCAVRKQSNNYAKDSNSDISMHKLKIMEKTSSIELNLISAAIAIQLLIVVIVVLLYQNVL